MLLEQGNMQKQNYNWLLALSINAWQKRDKPTADQGAPRPQLARVYAQAGHFVGTPTRAPNDLTASLFIWLLILYLSSAKKSANLISNRPFFCKLTNRQFFHTTNREPAWILAFAVMLGSAPPVPNQSPPHRCVANS